MFIIIFGAPGSGKGTVSKLLSEILKIKHVSTGDMFRQEMKNKTEFNKKIEKYIKNGLLVPDEIVNKIVEKEIEKNPKGLILDGYPRTINQAKYLQKILTLQNKKIDMVLKLDIKDEEIIYRTEKRRICSNEKCGDIYNLEFKKPNVYGKCNKCSSNLYQREDDKEKIIKKRLKVYHSRSKDIIKYFENLNLITNIELSINKNITKSDLEKYL